MEDDPPIVGVGDLNNPMQRERHAVNALIYLVKAIVFPFCRIGFDVVPYHFIIAVVADNPIII